MTVDFEGVNLERLNRSEGHQVSVSWGQYTNLYDISKLSTELFIPRKQEERYY